MESYFENFLHATREGNAEETYIWWSYKKKKQEKIKAYKKIV